MIKLKLTKRKKKYLIIMCRIQIICKKKYEIRKIRYQNLKKKCYKNHSI